MDKEIDGRGFYDVISYGEDERALSYVESILELKEAEMRAEEFYEWAEIAQMWLERMGEYGLHNAVRCMGNVDERVGFALGFIECARAWLKIAAYNPGKIRDAWRLMNLVEEDLEKCPDIFDICKCAETWAAFPCEQSHERACAMLAYAESRFQKMYSNEVLAEDQRIYDECCKHIDECRQVVNEYAPKPLPHSV